MRPLRGTVRGDLVRRLRDEVPLRALPQEDAEGPVLPELRAQGLLPLFLYLLGQKEKGLTPPLESS